MPAVSPVEKPAHSYVIGGRPLSAPKARAGLYLVATPIGNLGDITLRALETLAGVDLIACEDTRVSRRLIERFSISTPLTPYHEHNAAAVRPRLLAQIAAGRAIALISDAGTPLISDPGFKLVRDACAAAMAVTALPGASSVLTALSLAALPTDRFFFEGFLPAKEAARRQRLQELARIEATLVLFETGPRLAAALRDLADVMGMREAAICREMTKLHETVTRGSLTELAANADAHETRGEFVIVVGPPDGSAFVMDDAGIDALLMMQLKDGSVRDAVAHVVEASGRPRREIYARALEFARGAAPRGDSDGEP